jgi:hypothetical protein
MQHGDGTRERRGNGRLALPRQPIAPADRVGLHDLDGAEHAGLLA